MSETNAHEDRTKQYYRVLAFLAMLPLIFATIIIAVGVSDNVAWPPIPS